MKKFYITFSGAAYDETTSRIVEFAPRFGANEVLVYDDRWLMGTEFYQLNKWLWTYPDTTDPKRAPRGFGWFCWKPFIILDCLNRMQDGDIVLFTDADTFPIHDFSMLYEECARIGGTMLFSANGCDNANWCKEDCYIVMAQDEPEFRISRPHGVARFMLFQKGPWHVKQFLMEWLTYCLNRYATTFNPSEILKDPPELHEHRTEQAIMTLLSYKYGHKLYREACQFGATQPEDQELYPQLFQQVGCAHHVKSLAGSRFRNV